MFWTVPAGFAFAGAIALAVSGAYAPAKSAISQPASGSVAISNIAVHGRAAFDTYCSVCHGPGGQGFIGPRISGIPWTEQSLLGFVRNGLGGYGGMPAFSQVSVSDDDVAAIADYLGSETVAATKRAKTTPQPAPIKSTDDPDTAHGSKLYAANCSACHGAQGQGAFGPSLHNERSRKDFAATVSWIENPAAPMPKLYPSPLSEQDVKDVAAFVEKL